MNIRIDQDAVDLPGDLITWGDVLEWLETDYFKAGQCITRVKFGSDEASRYRDERLCQQELNAIEPIDVESGDFDSVIQESLAEIETELDRVRETGDEIIRRFEAREQDAAYTLLTEYLESIGVLFSVFAQDLGWVHGEGPDPRPRLIGALEEALAQLISAQEHGFWISVCDVLEYEVSPVLDGWKALVNRTRSHVR